MLELVSSYPGYLKHVLHTSYYFFCLFERVEETFQTDEEVSPETASYLGFPLSDTMETHSNKIPYTHQESRVFPHRTEAHLSLMFS